MTPTSESIRATLKELIVDGLNLEGVTPKMIEDDQAVFGEEFGLDSVDALELMVMIEKRFGVKIEGREIDAATFESVSTLAAFVESLLAEQGQAEPA